VWAELLSGRDKEWSAHRITLEGHTDAVHAIVFSPNGQFLVSASENRSIRVWDVLTGICRSTMVGHTDRIWSLGFSSDGSLLATGSSDKTTRLWNTCTWSHKATLTGHTEKVVTLAWSQDCLFIATGSYDGTVKLWDVEKELCYATLEGHTDSRVHAVAISPDNQLVAFASDDSKIRIWDKTTILCSMVINYEHCYSIDAIQFWPNSRVVAAALRPAYYESDIETRLPFVCSYDVETGRSCISFCAGPIAKFVAFLSNSGNLVFLEENTIKVWDQRTGICHTEFEGCTDTSDIRVISPDLTSVATAHAYSPDGSIKIWDMAAIPSGNTTHEDDVLFPDEPVYTMTASPDGKLFASRHYDAIRVWDSATAACIHKFGCAWATNQYAPNLYLRFSPNSLILAYGTAIGHEMEIRLQSMQTWSRCTFFDRSYRVIEVGFSQEGELLVSCSTDGIVRLWNIADGTCMSVLRFGQFGNYITLLSITGQQFGCPRI
jgi:WD40 repeat protein